MKKGAVCLPNHESSEVELELRLASADAAGPVYGGVIVFAGASAARNLMQVATEMQIQIMLSLAR